MLLKTILILALNLASGAFAFTALPPNHAHTKMGTNPTSFSPFSPLLSSSDMAISPRNGKTRMMLAKSDDSFDAIGRSKNQIEALVDENAWDDGVDKEKAKKLLAEAYEELTVIAVTDTSVTDVRGEENVGIAWSSCDDAAFWLTVDVAALFVSLLGLPGGITKKAAKKIAQKAGKKLSKEVTKIAKKYFQDASDLLSVANGLIEFFGLLLEILSPANLAEIIIGEMKWWEVPIYGALVLANIVLLFAASAPAIVIKLALVAPAIADVVGSTIEVINACG